MKKILTKTKNLYKIIFITIALFLFISNTALGDTNIHLTIKTNSGNIFDQDMSVAPCNNDNGATSDLKITAYCAVNQTGMPGSWNWSWPPGAFLDSLNSISGFTSQDKDGNNVYHYWSWSVNGVDGVTGLNQYELAQNDLITLTFVDPIEEKIVMTIGGTAPTYKKEKIKLYFNNEKAFDFLISKQKTNGSFGEDLYTDWVTIAIASSDKYNSEKELLKKYFIEEKVSNDWSLTDYERRAMALMALGENPYNTNGINYIEKITNKFDGKQFGNPFEDNDDIFALLVLQNAGFKSDEAIIKNTIDFILLKQKTNGSWDNSIDLTGAAMESLSIYKESPEVNKALEKAKGYLTSSQREDGGFNNNVSSTAWAIEGILALGESLEDWKKNDYTPVEYLAKNQGIDGGIIEADTNSKIWETAYATSVASGKSWNKILQKFEKPINITEITKTQKKEKEIIKTSTAKNKPAKSISFSTTTNTTSVNKEKIWWKKILENFRF